MTVIVNDRLVTHPFNIQTGTGRETAVGTPWFERSYLYPPEWALFAVPDVAAEQAQLSFLFASAHNLQE